MSSVPKTKGIFASIFGKKKNYNEVSSKGISYSPFNQFRGQVQGPYQVQGPQAPAGLYPSKPKATPGFSTTSGNKKSNGGGTNFTTQQGGSSQQTVTQPQNNTLAVGSFYDGTKPYLLDADNQQKDLDRLYAEEYKRLSPYYDQLTGYEKTKLGNFLSDAQGSFDRYTQDAATNFEADRYTLDQNEANKGTLFSSGRTTRRTDLQGKYTRDYEDKLAQTTAGIRDTALNAEYNLGSKALKGTNFNIGTMNFDANALRPTVTRGTTSVYKPTGKYSGRVPAERKTNALTRAYQRQGRVTNDTLPTYYNND